jgi:hypothetical protein
LTHVLGRDPRLRQPAIGEQLAQPTRVLAIGLRAPLGTPQRSRLHRLGQMRRRARRDQLLDHEPPAGRGLHSRLNLLARQALQKPPHTIAIGRTDATTPHLTRLGVKQVIRDLLAMLI